MDGRIGWIGWMDGMDGWYGWYGWMVWMMDGWMDGWMVLSREVDVWGEVKEGIPDRLMSVEFEM